MNFNNLPPFYVGQKVVYIKNISLPYNSVHTVLEIKTTECGVWSIFVGKMSGNKIGGVHTCNVCGKLHKNTGKLFHLATSFVPLQETFESISFEKVIEKESLLISVN